MGDHVPRLRSMPPQDPVAPVVGCITGQTALHIARTFRGRRKHSTGPPGGARGDSVSTVGRDEAVMRADIRTQEAEDRRWDHRDWW